MPIQSAQAPVAYHEIETAASVTSRLDSELLRLLRCPVCRAELEEEASTLVCTDSHCRSVFPVVDGIPVLINERESLFHIEEIVAGRAVSAKVNASTWKQRVVDALPQLGRNYRAAENYARLRDELRRRPGVKKRVLVVGGGVLGCGVELIADDPTIELFETDVFFGPRARYVVDAHDLPFRDGLFDAVIMQGVLGALIDPNKAIGEIERVLQPDGLIYVETPFVQQVCMGRFDFQRYSHLGLRRLFSSFEEIRSGAQAGPAMALAWSYQYLLWSFVNSRRGRSLMLAVARLTAWWLPHIDRFLLDRPAGIDGASGVFFLGRKSERRLSSRELIALYRGAFA